ncbi:hypothetical protein [Streptomyces europaeiscabiei]|uniref:hypothetical protein n=1 Tax=Streptomyces europaeiscabiei TaxID=146819 RepID=UPI002E19A734
MFADVVDGQLCDACEVLTVLEHEASGDPVGQGDGVVVFEAVGQEETVGVAHDRPVFAGGGSADGDVPGCFTVYGCPGEELAQVAGAPALGGEPCVDVGLGAVGERAAGGAEVLRECVGSAQLFEQVAGVMGAEAAGALGVFVGGGQEGPAQVAGQQQSVGGLVHVVECRMGAVLGAGQMFVPGGQEADRGEQAAQVGDGGGLAELVEALMGAGEVAGQEAVDQPAAGAAEVGDEGVRAGVVGQVLAQGCEFGPEVVGACGEHFVEALGGAAGRAAPTAVDAAHAAAHGAGIGELDAGALGTGRVAVAVAAEDRAVLSAGGAGGVCEADRVHTGQADRAFWPVAFGLGHGAAAGAGSGLGLVAPPAAAQAVLAGGERGGQSDAVRAQFGGRSDHLPAVRAVRTAVEGAEGRPVLAAARTQGAVLPAPAGMALRSAGIPGGDRPGMAAVAPRLWGTLLARAGAAQVALLQFDRSVPSASGAAARRGGAGEAGGTHRAA